MADFSYDFNVKNGLVIEGLFRDKILNLEIQDDQYTIFITKTLSNIIIPSNIKDDFNIKEYNLKLIGEEEYYSVFCDSHAIVVHSKDNKDIEMFNTEWVLDNLDTKPFSRSGFTFISSGSDGGLMVYSINDKKNKIIGYLITDE